MISADACAIPSLHLDPEGHPTPVAGVPPDFFSKTGQLWGNPLYRWNVSERTTATTGGSPASAPSNHFDIVLLDHFRGFEFFLGGARRPQDGGKGRLGPGPGAALFRAVERRWADCPSSPKTSASSPRCRGAAGTSSVPRHEDPAVRFPPDPLRTCLYLPHNYECNSVVYSGTHDNYTTRGWWIAGPSTGVLAGGIGLYLGRHGDDISWGSYPPGIDVRCSDRVIFPLQDLLNVGSEGRMNTPGRMSGNWSWRFTDDMLNDGVRERLKGLTEIYGRAPAAAETPPSLGKRPQEDTHAAGR